MEKVGSYEAKTHLSKLLDRVAQGEAFLITKHGVPIAVLQAPSDKPIADPQKVIDAIKAFRKGNRLEGLSLKEMMEEGRY